jgi:hypothetical protein
MIAHRTFVAYLPVGDFAEVAALYESLRQQAQEFINREIPPERVINIAEVSSSFSRSVYLSVAVWYRQ